jgi:ribose-phosphate pyrophosphokinase
MHQKLLKSKEVILIADARQALFARALAKQVGLKLIILEQRQFTDGEFELDLEPLNALSDVHALIVHATCPPVHHNLMWMLLVVHALQKRHIPVSVLTPYYAYARQEAAFYMIADLLQAAGISSLITIELHEPSYVQHASLPIEHITLDAYMTRVIYERYPLDQLTIVAPDEGAIARAQAVAQQLDVPLVICAKTRDARNTVHVTAITGLCRTRYAIIIDDIIDTGATIIDVAHAIRSQSSSCIIDAFAIHGLFSGNALPSLRCSELRKICVTNTVEHTELLPENIEVVDVAEIVAKHLLSCLSSTA